MSKVAELDHRIGRHEGKPHPDCPLCDSTVAFAVPSVPEGAWWDFEGEAGHIAFPDWGAIWRRTDTDTPLVFAQSSDESGFWAPMSMLYANTKPGQSFFDVLGHIQMEFPSKRWHPRAKLLAAYRDLPSEAALSGPLGQDLPRMAAEQNFAKLIVSMSEQRMFPVSDAQNEISQIAATNMTKVTTTVYAVPLPPPIR